VQQLQPAAQFPEESKAAASMVLGILSLTCFGVLAGIPAVRLGHMTHSNIRQSGGRLGGGKATAGRIMGYLSVFPAFLILAAIVIPSLVRSRAAANETSAAASVRALNTAQITYSSCC
jgi:ABC-type Fe3+ transport system permease subunit